MGGTGDRSAREDALLTVPLPRIPADDLAGWIAADGRAHPSTAIRRDNPALPVELDPFIWVSFPPVAAFRRGVWQARRRAIRTAMPTGGDERQQRFNQLLGRRVKLRPAWPHTNC